MSDIAERMRQIADLRGDTFSSMELWGVMREAAAEIEYLRAANAELTAALRDVQIYLQNGKWQHSDGVDNFIRAAIAKAEEGK